MDDEEKTRVVLHTPHYIIEGDIALVPGARLTDYIREESQFIAITAANVKQLDGTFLFDLPFLDLRRDSIEIAYPKSVG